MAQSKVALLGPGEKGALAFSGGKDSTAALYLARPWLDRITVLFADSGATFPHVRAFVEETCAGLGATLQIVRPPIDVLAYHAIAGLPADIVPVEADAEMAPFLAEKPGTMLQPYVRCCAAMLWRPMAEAVKALGASVVIRGSKAADSRAGAPDGHVEDGITYRSPLWDWTDADVLAYLEREGVTLPAHYPAVPDSMDCWACSAHLAHHGAAKLRWMREHTPALHSAAAERIARVRAALLDHAGRIGPALKEAAL
jgi:3'-phosphoadenosine 5'-phosphosulfate sulfotransferase (PAPS reductase)/FAD synthetase